MNRHDKLNYLEKELLPFLMTNLYNMHPNDKDYMKLQSQIYKYSLEYQQMTGEYYKLPKEVFRQMIERSWNQR